MKHQVIGLTGGMGCGKSTVSAVLQSLGYHIVDADSLTREVHQNPDVIASLVDAFGSDIVGQVNGQCQILRGELARIAFSSPEKRLLLNQIMMPALKNAAQTAILHSPSPVVLDAPLLFEAGWHDMTQKNIVVLCPLALRIQRIILRDGLPETQIRARIHAQMSDEARCRLADYFIYNCGELSILKAQIRRIVLSL